MYNKYWGNITDILECHSGTTKAEILSFIDKHQTGKCVVHAENNISNSWGDDSEVEYGLKTQRQQIIKDIETHYIHNIIIK